MIEKEALLRLGRNLSASATYWYFNGSCCYKASKNAALSSETAAWLITMATVIILSSYELVPSALIRCETLRHLYNVIAAIAYSHFILCYFWLELISAVSALFGFLDHGARKSGLPILTDNLLYTVRAHGGYINLYTFIASLIFLFAIIFWIAKSMTRESGRCPSEYQCRQDDGSSSNDEC